ncbi:MAG: hypothetical protein AAGJ18_26825, partial [Bacteroidota bacterium]
MGHRYVGKSSVYAPRIYAPRIITFLSDDLLDDHLKNEYASGGTPGGKIKTSNKTKEKKRVGEKKPHTGFLGLGDKFFE